MTCRDYLTAKQEIFIAERLKAHKINKIAALLHDIGKPGAREEIPFESKKFSS